MAPIAQPYSQNACRIGYGAFSALGWAESRFGIDCLVIYFSIVIVSVTSSLSMRCRLSHRAVTSIVAPTPVSSHLSHSAAGCHFPLVTIIVVVTIMIVIVVVVVLSLLSCRCCCKTSIRLFWVAYRCIRDKSYYRVGAQNNERSIGSSRHNVCMIMCECGNGFCDACQVCARRHRLISPRLERLVLRGNSIFPG